MLVDIHIKNIFKVRNRIQKNIHCKIYFLQFIPQRQPSNTEHTNLCLLPHYRYGSVRWVQASQEARPSPNSMARRLFHFNPRSSVGHKLAVHLFHHILIVAHGFSFSLTELTMTLCTCAEDHDYYQSHLWADEAWWWDCHILPVLSNVPRAFLCIAYSTYSSE